jgi:hypothetical protein
MLQVPRPWYGGLRWIIPKDSAPVWVKDLTLSAHNGMLSDNYRYQMIAGALEAIASSDDTEDAARKWADAYVPVYIRDLCNLAGIELPATGMLRPSPRGWTGLQGCRNL